MAERNGRPETVEVKKRRLRGALRQARLDRDMTQKRAADGLVWSVSKIIRIEQGSVPVTPSDVRALLQFYDATNAERIEELVDLAKEAREDSVGTDEAGAATATSSLPGRSNCSATSQQPR